MGRRSLSWNQSRRKDYIEKKELNHFIEHYKTLVQ